jgi:O-acetylserine/cysteine efflux transporter
VRRARTGNSCKRLCPIITARVFARISRRRARPLLALKTHLTPRDLALTLAVVAVLGYTFVPVKVALREVPPFTLAAVRFVLAALPMVFFVRPPNMPLRGVIAYGLAIGVFQFGFIFLGIKLGMPVGLASLVIQMQVFFTIGLAVAFAGDRVRPHNLVAAAIAITGIVVLAMYKFSSGVSGTAIGFALVIAAAFAWAVGNIIAKRSAGQHGADMFALTVWSSLVPPLPLLALGFAFEGGANTFRIIAGMSPLAWGCALVMSYGATLFGFGSWNALLHRYPTTLISPFALLIPVFGLASGVLFLDESLAPMQIAGVALVFVGLVWNVYGLRLNAAVARLLDGRH